MTQCTFTIPTHVGNNHITDVQCSLEASDERASHCAYHGMMLRHVEYAQSLHYNLAERDLHRATAVLCGKIVELLASVKEMQDRLVAVEGKAAYLEERHQ
jgi:hypothetical protein